jgi:hypothetical protein
MQPEPAIEVVDVDPSTELEVYEPAPAPLTLFGTNDPDIALKRMSEIAERLIDVVRDRKLVARIQGKEYLTAEAWQVVGGMVGVLPVVVWTKPNETGDGYVARVEARTLSGQVVGAAEAECSRAEKVWKDRYPSTLRAMAQTRAVSRALRAPLGQIVALAGYDAAAAEEMPPIADGASAAPEPSRSAAAPVEPTREQWAEIETLIRTLQGADPETDWKMRSGELAGARARMLTKTGAEMLIEKLQAELLALVESDEEGE